MSVPEATSGAPREVLFQYFRELLDLNALAMAEAQTAQELGRELDLEDLRARKAAIRDRFCTKRWRKTDGVVGYGLLEAKAYDPSNLNVERETPESDARVLVIVHNRALRERWQYLLVLRDGRWLIDSVQLRDGRKWRPVPLD